jgi:hypothetical protein
MPATDFGRPADLASTGRRAVVGATAELQHEGLLQLEDGTGRLAEAG